MTLKELKAIGKAFATCRPPRRQRKRLEEWARLRYEVVAALRASGYDFGGHRNYDTTFFMITVEDV